MWFVVILFASWNSDGSQNIFLFNNPVYDTELECRATLLEKQSIQKYVDQLIIAYEGVLPGPIDKVNCINKQHHDELMEQFKRMEGKKST